MKSKLLFLLSLSVFACGTLRAQQTATVTVSQTESVVTIGNSYLERSFAIAGDKLLPSEIVNKRTGDAPTSFIPDATTSEEFVIATLGAAENLGKIAKKGWSIVSCSSYQNDGGYGLSKYMIDDNIQSWWHTNYGGGTGSQSFPYNVVIDLGAATTFAAFGYTPRQQGENTNGNLARYELWAGTDGYADANLTKVASGTFSYDGVNTIYVNLSQPVTARYLKLVALSARNGLSFAACAEFDLLSKAYTATESCIKASQLTLQQVSQSDLAQGGKALSFQFAPYSYQGVDWEIAMHVEMADGDHYLKKYLELSVPASQRSSAAIDYIDFELLGTSTALSTWTHPSMSEGVGGLSGYHISLGQPVYVNGLFMGSEFPACETEIDGKTAHIRYYSGKSFATFNDEGYLTAGDKLTTWKSVCGASRSTTDMDVIRSDFFSYIDDISVPSDFRLQYNSWYDFMMSINESNIISSFKEMESGFSQYGVRPIDSYVVDDGWNCYGDYASENTTGFWQFNSKFPNGLTLPSDWSHSIGSNFGLWLGPRGGYNYYSSFARVIENAGKGAYNNNSADIVTNHKQYIKYLREFFLDCQNKYDVNYWKLDGFMTTPPQASTDGSYISGGYNGMYYVTEHWERWAALLKVMRDNCKTGSDNFWINLTCYVNPSPWLLQWANSVWIQNSTDIGRIGSYRQTDVDKLLTYRDDRYFDFVKTRQFQFPLANLYNHDPIYGKTGGVSANAMNDDEFREYLYMMGTRGTAFWELYYSYSLMNEGYKWMINAEAMSWIEENFHILRNSKLFGSTPGSGNCYGFSCWDKESKEGIISVRNPNTSAKTFTFTLDRSLGVPEDAGSLHRYSVMNANAAKEFDAPATFSYGDKITISLASGEVHIWKFTTVEDVAPPALVTIKNIDEKRIKVEFDEPLASVTTARFAVEGKTIKSAECLPDYRTVVLSLNSALESGNEYRLTVRNLEDRCGNALDCNQPFIYHANHRVVELNEPLHGDTLLVQGLSGRGDFGLAFILQTTQNSISLYRQGDEVEALINSDGNIVFTVCDLSLTTKRVVSDGLPHEVYLCREVNGALKAYIDGTSDLLAYDRLNLNRNIVATTARVGDESVADALKMFVLFDKAHTYSDVEGGLSKLDVVVKDAFNSDMDTIRWYKICNHHNGKYLYANSSNALCVRGKGEETMGDKYLWCFVGDSKNGYYIYNKANKKSVNTQFKANSTDAVKWRLDTSDSFSGAYYINSGVAWHNADASTSTGEKTVINWANNTSVGSYWDISLAKYELVDLSEGSSFAQNSCSHLRINTYPAEAQANYTVNGVSGDADFHIPFHYAGNVSVDCGSADGAEYDFICFIDNDTKLETSADGFPVSDDMEIDAIWAPSLPLNAQTISKGSSLNSIFCCATKFYSLPNVRLMNKLRTSDGSAIAVSGLPAGLQWNDARGCVEGSVSQEGTYYYTAESATGESRTITLVVSSDLPSPTPFMGWFTWNLFDSNYKGQNILDIIDAFYDKKLVDYGYKYVVIDDNWQTGAGTRSTTLPKWDTSRFASGKGIDYIAGYAHDKGMKLGIYTDVAATTCAGEFGSLGYEFVDACAYSGWGIDFVKEDFCNCENGYSDSNSADATSYALNQYRKMRAAIDYADALRADGRRTLFNVCEWGERNPWEWAGAIGSNMWRISWDRRDAWDMGAYRNGFTGVMQVVDRFKLCTYYAGVNQYNDGDMMTLGLHGEGSDISANQNLPGNMGLTDVEARSEFSLWCMFSAPLSLSLNPADNSMFTPATEEILKNYEMIAIDQDPMGQQAECLVSSLSYDSGVEVYLKDLANGDYAIALLNRGSEAVSYTLDLSILPFEDSKTHYWRDLWQHQIVHITQPSDSNYSIGLQPHETKVFRVGTDPQTAIRVVSQDDDEANVRFYDLGGRPVKATEKGVIYITKGEKLLR